MIVQRTIPTERSSFPDAYLRDITIPFERRSIGSRHEGLLDRVKLTFFCNCTRKEGLLYGVAGNCLGVAPWE